MFGENIWEPARASDVALRAGKNKHNQHHMKRHC
jgi:hypothetical protein